MKINFNQKYAIPFCASLLAACASSSVSAFSITNNTGEEIGCYFDYGSTSMGGKTLQNGQTWNFHVGSIVGGSADGVTCGERYSCVVGCHFPYKTWSDSLKFTDETKNNQYKVVMGEKRERQQHLRFEPILNK